MAKKDILPIKPYYEQALRERVFDYSPEATRNFFHQATHREPMTLWTHFYHYWDKAQAQAGAAREPDPPLAFAVQHLDEPRPRAWRPSWRSG